MKMVDRIIMGDRVVCLICKYLRSGVIDKGLWHASEKSTPQGGPLI